MNSNTLSLLSNGLDVGMKIMAILMPIIVAFWLRKKDALNRLIASAPAIYDVVQSKRQQQGLAPLPTVIKDMVQLGSQLAGRALTEIEQLQLETALTAHDARLSDQGHTSTPLVPTLGGIPLVKSVGAPGGTPVAASGMPLSAAGLAVKTVVP